MWNASRSTLASVSPKLRDMVVRFWDIVKDSDGYLSPYKVLSHLYWKCQHGGVETEIKF